MAGFPHRDRIFHSRAGWIVHLPRAHHLRPSGRRVNQVRYVARRSINGPTTIAISQTIYPRGIARASRDQKLSGLTGTPPGIKTKPIPDPPAKKPRNMLEPGDAAAVAGAIWMGGHVVDRAIGPMFWFAHSPSPWLRMLRAGRSPGCGYPPVLALTGTASRRFPTEITTPARCSCVSTTFHAATTLLGPGDPPLFTSGRNRRCEHPVADTSGESFISRARCPYTVRSGL